MVMSVMYGLLQTTKIRRLRGMDIVLSDGYPKSPISTKLRDPLHKSQDGPRFLLDEHVDMLA